MSQHTGGGVWGEIEIGDFREDLVVPTGYWSKSDYINHWKNSVNVLLEGNKNRRAALITEMYDPRNANYINCWPLYREGDIVYVHNRLLFLKDIPEPFIVEKVGEYIGDRETVDKDGHQISEWRTSVAELRNWLDKLGKQSLTS